MDNPTALKRWLAAVRVVTGGVFVYMASGHLLAGWATADGFQRAIAGFAKTDPLQAYTGLMVPTMLAAPGLFGPLFVFGMLAAGVWLSLNNLLMGFGAGGVHHGINILMLTVELGFLWTGAWRPYSLDRMLFADRARGVWRRAPVGQRG